MAQSHKPKASANGVNPWRVFVIFCLFLLLPAQFVFDFGAHKVLPVEGLADAAETPSKGKHLLDELVRKAKKEGELVAAVTTSWSKRLIRPLGKAFRKRFGMDIKVTIANVESSQRFAVAIAESQAGAPATYDVVQGTDSETAQLSGGGGTQRIEGWEALLAEINPLVRSGKVRPEQISQGPLRGQAFMFMANVKQLIYNTKLISEGDLPRTHAELGDSKYKDKFAQPPWTTHWDLGPVAFDKFDRSEWLDVVKRAGKNTGAVLYESAGVQRVVLGEFMFVLAQDRYMRKIFAKDPTAPIASRFFDDYNGFTGFYYSVRTRARHPAAAALWALWMTTPEAAAIWQPSDFMAVPYGESRIDREFRGSIEKAKGRVIGFLDNEKTVELLKWYGTEEGMKYLEAVARGIRGE